MPRSSNGTYTQPANTAAVSGQTISSVAFNTLESDIGNEITNSLDRLGRSSMQANLPMAGYLINNLGNAVVATDALPKGQADAAYLPLTANAVANSNLAQAPQSSVKGTYYAAAASTATVTISIASPAVITWAGHGLSAGTPVTFKTTGALPTGISQNVEYYVITTGLGANSFQISTTVGGTAVNTSGTQSGAHTGSAYAMAGEQDLSYPYLGAQLTSFVSQTPMAVALSAKNNAATPDTKIDITALYAILSSFSGGNGVHSGVNVTINATTVGANGIDAGALANSTWYYLWLISTGTTVAGLLSLSSIAPTLPAGYFYALRVGAARTDASAKFYRFIQTGRRTQYVVTAGTNTATMPQMGTGVSGNVVTPTWTAASPSPLLRAADRTRNQRHRAVCRLDHHRRPEQWLRRGYLHHQPAACHRGCRQQLRHAAVQFRPRKH